MATVLEQLIPAVDAARRVAGDPLGWYATRVWICKRTWTGERRGEGVPTDPVEMFEIDPRPRVKTGQQMVRHMAVGLVEDGDLVVDGVSARYTESQIRGLALAENEELTYKAERVANTFDVANPESLTGRFTLMSANKRGDPLGWTLILRPQVP